MSVQQGTLTEFLDITKLANFRQNFVDAGCPEKGFVPALLAYDDTALSTFINGLGLPLFQQGIVGTFVRNHRNGRERGRSRSPLGDLNKPTKRHKAEAPHYQFFKDTLKLIKYLKNYSNVSPEASTQHADPEDTIRIISTSSTPTSMQHADYHLGCIIQHKKGHNIAVIKRQALYVRQSYVDLYKVLIRATDAGDKTSLDYYPKYLLTGTSGIGKSCFLAYLLIELLLHRDVVVIFQPPDGELVYCFEGLEQLGVGRLSEFMHHLNSVETWYLVDSVTGVWDLRAITVIAMSPNSIANDKFELEKTIVNTYHMPPWTMEELIICRKYVFPTIPQQLMLTLYDKAGGVPRYVLQRPTFLISQYNPNDPENLAKIIATTLQRIYGAIQEVGDFERLVRCLSEDAKFIKFSNRLIHRWPTDLSYDGYHRAWASDYIYQSVEKKLNDEIWNKLYRQIQDQSNPFIARGIMFESYVRHILPMWIMKELMKLFTHTSTTTLSAPCDIEESMFTLPKKPQLDCIFQSTVSLKHPIKQKELVDLVKNMAAYRRNHDTTIRLYFVVPADIYDDFTYQAYLTREKKPGDDVETLRPVIRESRTLQNVEQWVLRVDTTRKVPVFSRLAKATVAVATSCAGLTEN
ncbi:7853_t:CDS:2 [Paraglomus occultum]|uniref:7853_t:CDS:1 n=1 Tax=Paraglomus occultum TaxID=144539 RepID=A0A9N9CQW4_9GLOM|nr:7853_t:CDS:2 [Paraglomus occultum]